MRFLILRQVHARACTCRKINKRIEILLVNFRNNYMLFSKSWADIQAPTSALGTCKMIQIIERRRVAGPSSKGEYHWYLLRSETGL